MTGSADGGDRAAPAPHSAERLPDFFIVGQPKSGTTALYEMLRRLPQVFMSDLKEPRYFSSDLPSPYQPRAPGEPPAATYQDYLDLFAPATPGQLVGEASTSYIWSRTAAREIAAARPDARIIAIFREPASFVRSMHLQLLQINVEKERRLRRALELEAQRRQGHALPDVVAHWPAVLLYTDRVRYTEQLRRYHEAFAREQVLALVYDDFRADNEGTLRRVLEFLGLEHEGPVELLEANPSVRMRSVALEEALHAVSVGRDPASRAAKSVIKALTPRSLRRGAHRAVRERVVFGAPGADDEQLMLELRRRFKGEVQAFGDYLGRDLVSLWGYDELD